MRSVSLVSVGFVEQARSVAAMLGYPDLAIVEYPSVIMTNTPEEIRAFGGLMVDRIVAAFAAPAVTRAAPEPVSAPDAIAARGTLDEIHEAFEERLWTDGLPIVPPTVDRVEQFLRHTPREAGDVLGVLLPGNRAATVWSVAVNGVMAGCRPEYMPILVAAVEAIADPEFHVINGGSTPGWEPLVIVNGPIVRELDFNYETGAQRVGRRANTSVGRFLRLYMRNVAGLRIPPGTTDKGGIGMGFNVALAENEPVLEEIGWPPFSADRGQRAGDDVVTVQSVVGISPAVYTSGPSAETHLRTLAEFIGQFWAYHSASALFWGRWHNLLVMSPSVARVLAAEGLTKEDAKQYFVDHVHMRAGAMEGTLRDIGMVTFSLEGLVAEGRIPRTYALSDEPDRLVPAFSGTKDIGIVVAGDPFRVQSRGYLQNRPWGFPVSRRVDRVIAT
jgi:hypothetical protein